MVSACSPLHFDLRCSATSGPLPSAWPAPERPWRHRTKVYYMVTARNKADHRPWAPTASEATTEVCATFPDPPTGIVAILCLGVGMSGPWIPAAHGGRGSRKAAKRLLKGHFSSRPVKSLQNQSKSSSFTVPTWRRVQPPALSRLRSWLAPP